MLKTLVTSACLLSSFAIASESKPIRQCRGVVGIDSKIVSEGIRDNVDDVNPPNAKDFARAAEAVIGTIEGVYGPLKIKNQTISLQWDKVVSKLYGTIGGLRNPKDIFFEIANLLHQLKDSHVSVTLPSTLTWRLPFQMTYSPTENIYFINYLAPEALSEVIKQGEMPPLGAELLKVNGEDVNELHKRQYFNGEANEITSRAIFARTLTGMAESRGIPLSQFPSNQWKFTFLYPDGKIRDVVMEYRASGVPLLALDTVLPSSANDFLETVKENESKKPHHKFDAAIYGSVDKLIQDVNALLPLKKQDLTNQKITTTGTTVGQRFDFGEQKPSFKLPEDFKPMTLPNFFSEMAEGGHLFAGTFMHNGKRVGLLRIPSYGPKSIIMAPLELRYFINKLEKESDYLLLDQMDNPGGYVMYCDWITKAFVGKLDLSRHLKFQLKPTHRYMQDFAELLNNIESVATTPELQAQAKLVREQFEILHRAYISGEPLSQPISWTGTSEFTLNQIIAAHKESGTLDLIKGFTGIDVSENQVYTKPIFMLINHLDFSGGDATPAILQDYKRVKLIGSRTAGAGGPVQEFQENKRALEIDYRLTTGLMYRQNRSNPYIENYGVIPDIELQMTKDDYISGDTYLNKVLDLISKQRP